MMLCPLGMLYPGGNFTVLPGTPNRLGKAADAPLRCCQTMVVLVPSLVIPLIIVAPFWPHTANGLASV